MKNTTRDFVAAPETRTDLLGPTAFPKSNVDRPKDHVVADVVIWANLVFIVFFIGYLYFSLGR